MATAEVQKRYRKKLKRESKELHELLLEKRRRETAERRLADPVWAQKERVRRRRKRRGRLITTA